MRYMVLGALGALVLIISPPTHGAHLPPSYPVLEVATSTEASYNWAGYIAQAGHYTGISGSWVVPSVTPGAAHLSADATWVGIGGVGSSDLLQAGTQAVIDAHGTVVYQAWVEGLPDASEALPLVVEPGDEVSVSLTQTDVGMWRLSFYNKTSGEHIVRDVAYASSRTSAEWIEEMPSTLEGSFIPLNNFGTTRFTAASAVVNGQTTTLGSLDARPVIMVTRRGQVLAETSVVDANGGFAITRSDVATVPRRALPTR